MKINDKKRNEIGKLALHINRDILWFITSVFCLCPGGELIIVSVKLGVNSGARG
jgi:hypothetical protein